MNNRFFTIHAYRMFVRDNLSKGIFLFFGITAGVLSGCTVGPDFHRPSLAVPDNWLQQHRSVNDVKGELEQWWTLFNDSTLSSLEERALASNLDIKIAEARIRQARSIRNESASAAGPVVNSTGTYTRQQTRPGMITGYETNSNDYISLPSQQADTVILDQFQTGFDAGWELDIFGRVRREVEAGDAEIVVSIETRRDVLVSLTAEVARNYIDLRILQNRIMIIQRQHQALKRYAELVKKRFAGGLASGLDVVNAEAQASYIASQIPLIEALARQTMYKLDLLLGGYPGMLSKELRSTAPPPTVSIDISVGVPSELLRRRPDIRRAEAEIHVATARIGVAAADLFPKMTLTGSLSYLSSSMDSLYSPGNLLWSIGPSIGWNIFDSGRVRARIATKKALLDQSLIQYQQKVLSALLEVEDSLISLTKEEKHRSELEAVVKSNEKAVELANRLYTGGETNFLQVLLAERSLYIAKDAFMQSIGTCLTRRVALFKALGGGWM